MIRKIIPKKPITSSRAPTHSYVNSLLLEFIMRSSTRSQAIALLEKDLSEITSKDVLTSAFPFISNEKLLKKVVEKLIELNDGHELLDVLNDLTNPADQYVCPNAITILIETVLEKKIDLLKNMTAKYTPDANFSISYSLSLLVNAVNRDLLNDSEALGLVATKSSDFSIRLKSLEKLKERRLKDGLVIVIKEGKQFLSLDAVNFLAGMVRSLKDKTTLLTLISYLPPIPENNRTLYIAIDKLIGMRQITQLLIASAQSLERFKSPRVPGKVAVQLGKQVNKLRNRVGLQFLIDHHPEVDVVAAAENRLLALEKK